MDALIVKTAIFIAIACENDIPFYPLAQGMWRFAPEGSVPLAALRRPPSSRGTK